MSALPFILSKKAVADLNEIWFYTVETWSVEQANRYYNLIFDEINYICLHPDYGRSMDNVRKGYRMSKVKSHLIFYKVVKNTVEVIRILHERMDIENRLGK
jgi:toxin ParE1/3/4